MGRRFVKLRKAEENDDGRVEGNRNIERIGQGRDATESREVKKS